MSQPEHTPGPWRVDIDRTIVADHRARGIWREVVADVALPAGPTGHQERDANAQLIAAAPRLAGELHAIAGAVDAVLHYHGYIISTAAREALYTAAQAARAAIAEALGAPVDASITSGDPRAALDTPQEEPA